MAAASVTSVCRRHSPESLRLLAVIYVPAAALVQPQ